MPHHVLSHPIANTHICKLRQASTSPKDFREGIYQISLFLGVEATRCLEEKPFEGESPVGRFTGTVVRHQIGLIPILRAGLGMSDALLSLVPEAYVYHLGLFREKVSLQPVEYYSKLPAEPPVDLVYLLDPLIATGGTACAALAMLIDWGLSATKIKILCVLASQHGLDKIKDEYPDIEVWVGTIDTKLTDLGIIHPGLGDAGDRLFNTIQP